MKVTESPSNYDALENMPLNEILANINKEDTLVANAVYSQLSAIESLTSIIIDKVLNGGRLFYLGAGTSGRLGVLDASECPPTFGVDDNIVIGIIAGGDEALRKAKEGSEDDLSLAWQDLNKYQICAKDFVFGIASSGSTPYVLGGLTDCKAVGISTGALVCNPESKIAAMADYPIEVVVGPEFITGSTRMKAGTAQKMILNMVSTALMIKLGRVKGNRMVDMKLSNEKLLHRGIKMVMDECGVSHSSAEELLSKYKSVRSAIAHGKEDTNREALS